MSSEITVFIAWVGAAVGVLGGAIALFNAHKAVQWKKAELANSYLKEINSNQELIFACRSLDWFSGRLVVPDQLCPLVPDGAKTIQHDYDLPARSMQPRLSQEMRSDFRIQIYRTAIDSLLSWLNLIDHAIERNLFKPEDIKEVGYWVKHIESRGFVERYIDEAGYREETTRLRRAFCNVYTYKDMIPYDASKYAHNEQITASS